MQDPVQWLQNNYDKLLSFTQKEGANRNKFYQGADVNDPQAQSMAFAKLLTGLGIQTTAASAMAQAADPHSAQRINEQRETVNKSKGVNEVNDELRSSYAGATQDAKAALNDIGVIIGSSVLPQITKLLEMTRSFLLDVKQFGQDNPMTVQLTTIAAAASGVVMAFTGIGKLSGIVGSATGALGALTGATGGANTAAQAGAGIWGTFRQSIANAGTAFNTTQSYGAAAANTATAIGSSFGAAGTAV